jgi:YD repeat-containing protein
VVHRRLTGGCRALRVRLRSGWESHDRTDCDAASLLTHDVQNRVIQQQPGGTVRFAGILSEPATVTIQRKPATVDATNSFSGTASLVDTNPITVRASDPSGNVASAQYEIPLSGISRTFSYDANGNLTNDGTRTYEWDAADRLTAIVTSTTRTEFAYNGVNRRTRITEKSGLLTTSDIRLIWCEELCEERDSSAVVRARQF